MIELRWKVEKWEQMTEIGADILHVEKPVLQVRLMSNIEEIGLQPPIWSEWEDVPTEYIDV